MTGSKLVAARGRCNGTCAVRRSVPDKQRNAKSLDSHSRNGTFAQCACCNRQGPAYVPEQHGEYKVRFPLAPAKLCRKRGTFRLLFRRLRSSRTLAIMTGANTARLLCALAVSLAVISCVSAKGKESDVTELQIGVKVGSLWL